MPRDRRANNRTRNSEGRERGGFLGRGQQAPLHQLGDLGSAVSSPSGVRDGAPTAQRFSTIFSTQDGLSGHYNIVNCGLSCSDRGGRGQDRGKLLCM